MLSKTMDLKPALSNDDIEGGIFSPVVLTSIESYLVKLIPDVFPEWKISFSSVVCSGGI